MVGIATYPAHAHCRERFIDRLKEIAEYSSIKPYDIVIVWNGNEEGLRDYEREGYRIVKVKENPTEAGIQLLARKQNIIRDKFLNGNYTHLFMLESDNVPPKNIIEELLSHNLQIVSGLYFITAVKNMVKDVGQAIKEMGKAKGLEFDAAIVINQMPIPANWGMFRCELFERSEDMTTRSVRLWSLEDLIEFKIQGKRVVPIYASGVGCILFAREPMSKIPFSHIGKHKGDLTDFTWFSAAYKLGYTPYCDIDMMVQHYHFSNIEALGDFKKWFDPDKD